MLSFEIVKSYDKICDYVDRVKAAADSNRPALGFLPSAVYDESASQGRLWVAVSRNEREYLGHLLFGGTYPDLRVVQLFVLPSQQRHGVASGLIEELARFGQEDQYLAITARVAKDLPANRFWETCGFAVTRTVPGGKSKNRTINIRVRPLDVPRLFDLPVSTLSLATTIAYETRPVLKTPQYALDINIILDLIQHREAYDVVSSLVRAGFNHIVKIVVTDEASKELARSCPPESSKDPLLEFICQLPTLPAVSRPHVADSLEKLRALIFPHRSASRKGASRDESDLAHLASCIHHGIEGFITRETALLRSAQSVKTTFGLEVVSPYSFLELGLDESTEALTDLVARTKESEVRFTPFEEAQRQSLETFLNALGVEQEEARDAISPGASGNDRRRICAFVDGELIGVASWTLPSRLKSEIVLHLYVDETKREHQRVIEHVLARVLQEGCSAKVFGIHLVHGLGQTVTRSIALKRGFRSRVPSAADTLQPLYKISVNGVVTEQSWPVTLKALSQLSQVQLKAMMPSFEEVRTHGLKLSQRRHRGEITIDLFELETLMSPGLFLFTGRPGLVIPINETFAEELIGGISLQRTFLPAQEALLRVEKAYFRSPRRATLFSKGSPIVFYVSGKHGHAVGHARITSSAVLPVKDVVRQYERQGVLSEDQLAALADTRGRIHVFTFDNFLRLPQAVPYKELKSLGCISPANLVTAEPLAPERLVALMAAGYRGEE